jgi:hypothetical protein
VKSNGQDSMAAVNKGFPQAGLTCLTEGFCFLYTFVLADSLVLLSPAFSKPRTVSGQFKTIYINKNNRHKYGRFKMERGNRKSIE